METTLLPAYLLDTPLPVQMAWLARNASRNAKHATTRHARGWWYTAKCSYLLALIGAGPGVITLGLGHDDKGASVLLADIAGIGQVSFHITPERDQAAAPTLLALPSYPFQWVREGLRTWPRYNLIPTHEVQGVPHAYHQGKLSYGCAHNALVRAGLSPALLATGAAS